MTDLNLTIVWQAVDGGSQAHLAGCGDLAKLAKRGYDTQTNFTISTQIELPEKMSEMNVGSLEGALAEVGTYDGLWNASCAPCCRKQFKALPEGSPRLVRAVEGGGLWVASDIALANVAATEATPVVESRAQYWATHPAERREYNRQRAAIRRAAR